MRRLLLVLLLPFALVVAAHADETPSAADRAAIRDIVAQQLAAFQRDDAVTAFGFASPGIQQIFGTPEHFIDMVRIGYLPVYRPRQVDFGEITAAEGEIVQRVELVGPDGAPALALYFMQRQPDGSWRINGCVLTQSAQRLT
jgi:hypothetical protein